MNGTISGGDAAAASVPTVGADVLRAYFRSIEEPFRETRAQISKGTGPLRMLAVVLFIFSLIPLLPWGLSHLSSRLFDARPLTVWGVRFPLTSFWFSWIVSFAASLLFMIAVFKFSGPGKEEKERWLSPQQMRFAYGYAIVDEAQKYRTNHLRRHLEAAGGYLETVARSLLRAQSLQVYEGVYPEQYWQTQIHFSEQQEARLHSIHVLAPRPFWYKLSPDTEEILLAFGDFLPKLRDRLRDGKDLAVVESALTDLAGYFYTEVPEISDGSDDSRLQHTGMGSLLRFARKINVLPAYRSERRKPGAEEKVRRIASAGGKVGALFNHENPLVSFVAWYVLCLVLFAAGFRVAFWYAPGLKADSTVVTALVGGPIATAITAVAIPRVGRKKGGRTG